MALIKPPRRHVREWQQSDFNLNWHANVATRTSINVLRQFCLSQRACCTLLSVRAESE